MKFGLSLEDYNLLLDLAIRPLTQHGAEVWIFGSRARGDHKPFSDVDLLYTFSPPAKAPSGLVYDIKTNLAESRLSLKVDLVDEHQLASSYLQSVLNERVKLS